MSAGARVVGHLVRHRIRTALGVVVVAAVAVSGVNLLGGTAQAAAPVGSGFTLTPGDLSFILKQIKIAEHHSRAYLGLDPALPANPDPVGDPDYCQSMVGTLPDQIPDRLTAYGLRTVDGSCNNLFKGRDQFAASDVPFPRLATTDYRAAGKLFFDPDGPGPAQVGDPTSYAQRSVGNIVADGQPRLVSNLIADQTVTNPAAVDAALHPVRTQDKSPTATPCDSKNLPVGCTPTGTTLFIPNITTDVGLSPPFNSLFTFFGQFFDHGVDQTVKGGGTVFVPLAADDPLIVGPDGIAGTPDDPKKGDPNYVPQSQRFMVLTRAQNQPGPDGVLGTADDVMTSTNTDTPWVDNSQTYTSHASHQVFLREYAIAVGPDGTAGTADDLTVSTGRLLGGLPAGQTYAGSPDGTTGLPTWAAVKKQAREVLGLDLQDKDVTSVPQLLVDPYGRFVPGPQRGLPQYVTKGPDGKAGTADDAFVEGDRANPVPVPDDVITFDTPFLTDIAHNADPSPGDFDHNPTTPPTAPTPDADTTPSANFAAQAPGTYDDEMLDAHFICGDGRCNENIALSSIHQIFHSEHDRLVAQIKDVLTKDTSVTGQNALLEWQLPTAQSPDGWNGERLFQAARFVNEMEYQHTVFEEFARKVQPAVRPFHVYSPDIDPAIDAEFAHAVYRFGHSMLDDQVARVNEDAAGNKTDNSLPLLTAFLNPPELFDNGAGGAYTPEAAAGAIVMGSSDQTGNEIDEFVTQVLRNNLLGLPLDLATLNLTRARDAGVPRLNPFRRELYGKTGDSQLIPYTSWADFGQHIKHPSSLVNFVAAYGTHPTILWKNAGPDGDWSTTADNADPTLASRRAAARAIVDPQPAQLDSAGNVIQQADVPPADASDFLFSTGAWADDANGATTGLDDVDMWIGGLAENTNLNGGMLGSTFNYVFQGQLEKLQDGDRLYYLNRTPGMNLRTQLEGNSFSELIMRNTTGTHSLKADAFATTDCKFELGHLDGTAAAFKTKGSTVTDDPTTPDCDESKLLQRSPDGTIGYKLINGVDPNGINGQSVYNGTAGVDRVSGGIDNDTFWGNAGDDVIEGNGGDDVVLGGDGNDRITDSDGADVLKGGPGDDYIDAGPGNDITMGGDGSDVISGSGNDNETFAGPGNDFIRAGDGADTVFGDGGDDWIEGGSGQDLLQGDHGAPFFDDPAEPQPGNDVFVGQVGENDYDAEGGDDLMSQNVAIDRNAGAAGFDWAFHQFDNAAADDDMEINNNLAGLALQVVVNRDRWQETEADSGGNKNDVIRGTTKAPKLVGGAGFSGCNVLDPAGVARITGLDRLVDTFPSDLAAVVKISAAGYCPQTGLGGTVGNGQVWGEGDILLGGGGNDLLEGRANDDIIDGDHRLQVRISVRDANDHNVELGWTDLIEGANKKPGGSFGPGTTASQTLQDAIAKGLVTSSQLEVVREIVAPDGSPMGATADTGAAGDCDAATPVNCDVAMFSFPPANYRIDRRADGAVLVTQLGVPVGAGGGGGGGGGGGAATVGDGTDTLWNIEMLRFCTSRDLLTKQCLTWTDQAAPQPVQAPVSAPIITGVTAGAGSVTVDFFPTAGAPFLRFEADAISGGQVVGSGVAPGTSPSLTITGLTNGVPVTVVVRAVNVGGASPDSAPSDPVTPLGAPSAPTIGTASAVSTTTAHVTWTPPADDGGSPVTGYQVEALVGGFVQSVTDAPVGTESDVTGLVPGTTYTFQVRALNAVDVSPASAESAAVTLPVPATAPAVPAIGTASRGNASATVKWTAPADGGSPVTGYQVQVRLAGKTTVVGALRSAPAGATSLVVTGLTNGTAYDFRVRALNAVGTGTWSSRSNAVTPATVPDKPTIGTAVAGAAGGAITATAKWSAPAGDGGSAITGYKVIALRMSSTASNATVLETITSSVRPATARSYAMTLPKVGTYRFQVVAVNAVGTGARSSRSNAVAGR